MTGQRRDESLGHDVALNELSERMVEGRGDGGGYTKLPRLLLQLALQPEPRFVIVVVVVVVDVVVVVIIFVWGG